MSTTHSAYQSIEDYVGNTPLVRLQRIPGAANDGNGNVILAKLEGNNPAGSVKDRPALSMVVRAEQRGNHARRSSGNSAIRYAEAFQRVTPQVVDAL